MLYCERSRHLARSRGSEKSHRLDVERHIRNKSAIRTLRTAVKKVAETGTPEEREQSLRDAQGMIDRAGRKGLIHRNKASRMKSAVARKKD
jgi:small subunit ribosomal protein S20